MPSGVYDQGAYNPKDKTHEHDLNIKVRDYCAKELERFNCVVVKDTNLLGKAHDPNWQALKNDYARRNFKPDLLIEIHHDSYNAKDAGFGIKPKTIFQGKVGGLYDKITSEYVKRGLYIKPTYTDVRGLGLLKSTAFPTAIWECGATYARNDVLLQAHGVAIAQGIRVAFDLPAGGTANSVTPVDTIYKVREYLGLSGIGGQDKEFVSALIAWKIAHKYYPSGVLTDYILRDMGIK